MIIFSLTNKAYEKRHVISFKSNIDLENMQHLLLLLINLGIAVELTNKLIKDNQLPNIEVLGMDYEQNDTGGFNFNPSNN